MHYEGPIYRPPSEADSLLIQATVGCPHNKCSFCMVYKKGPAFRIRSVADICADIDQARGQYGQRVQTLFLPAGNTLAMPVDELAAVCRHARARFPQLKRITTYGSSQSIVEKGPDNLNKLRNAGLARIHVGMESGDDEVLKNVKKGVDAATQIQAGQMVKEAGIELSTYVILGLGGLRHSVSHALNTAIAVNAISPHFLRLRTLVPKINTLLLHQIKKGRFKLLTPHQVIEETRRLIDALHCQSRLSSDHYTNYLNLNGTMPEDRDRLLLEIDRAMNWDVSRFRPAFVGTQ